MPDWFLTIGIVIATIAAIIASQALISGSFTLISEAIRLNLWPRMKINYPSEAKVKDPLIKAWLAIIAAIVAITIPIVRNQSGINP